MNFLSTASSKEEGVALAAERRKRFTKPLFDPKNPLAAKMMCDVTDASVMAAIATMRQAAFKGADVFNLNVSLLDCEHVEEVAPAFAQIRLPVLTAVRRASFLTLYGGREPSRLYRTEEERIAVQLRCVELGAAGIDLELDSHDEDQPSVEAEIKAGVDADRAKKLGPIGDISFDPAVVSAQKHTVQAVKERGGFVLMSSHTRRPINVFEACLITQTAIERGADFVKIVVSTGSRDDQDELVRASLVMRKQFDVPFILMPMGQDTVAARIALFMLGGGWAVTQNAFVPNGFHQQPLIEAWLPIVNAWRAS
ncbi:MAG: type I 3-dehydroquinate dehydratase [Xanthobacteraceae bacterium]|nr:type I 3-dehydroquinate dehydratase [Xanthobacteraceae bacterium]